VNQVSRSYDAEMFLFLIVSKPFHRCARQSVSRISRRGIDGCYERRTTFLKTRSVHSVMGVANHPSDLPAFVCMSPNVNKPRFADNTVILGAGMQESVNANLHGSVAL
jgi:hypothetical protein